MRKSPHRPAWKYVSQLISHAVTLLTKFPKVHLEFTFKSTVKCAKDTHGDFNPKTSRMPKALFSLITDALFLHLPATGSHHPMLYLDFCLSGASRDRAMWNLSSACVFKIHSNYSVSQASLLVESQRDLHCMDIIPDYFSIQGDVEQFLGSPLGTWFANASLSLRLFQFPVRFTQKRCCMLQAASLVILSLIPSGATVLFFSTTAMPPHTRACSA